MNQNDILTNSITVEKDSLTRLQYWLKYEKYTLILGASVGMLPYSLIIKGLSSLAILFTPYMLWHLFRASWYKSLVIFSVVVILPFITFQFVQTGNQIFNLLLQVLPLIAFYSYTWGLSYKIREYLSEIQALNKFKTGP